MTNESISGFLNSIAEAKRAFDAEPQYQSRIQQLSDDINRLQSTVAARELRIHDLKQAETDLTAKLRSVEAERDDAGFRALESDEKVQTLLMVVRDFVRSGLEAISAIEGKESIVIGKQAVTDLEKQNHDLERSLFNVQAELDRLKNEMASAQEQLTRPFAPTDITHHTYPKDTPIGETSSATADRHDMFPEDEYYTKGKSAADPFPASASDPAPRGQSDPLPTSPEQSNVSVIADSGIGTQRAESEGPFAETIQTAPSGLATSTSAATEEDAASHGSAPERNRDESTRFLGRKYYDVTYFVPKHEWLAKGGTEADYEWRPAPLYPQPNRASHNS